MEGFYLGYVSRAQCPTGKCQDRNLKQKVRAGTIENTVSWFAYRFFVYLSFLLLGTICLGNGTAQRSLGPIASTNNQSNLQQMCPQASIIWAISNDSRQCH